jgi:antitoxin component of MazEF toxin-antitoxin module
MLIKLTPIGNSKGIRIPQNILREIEFTSLAELEVKNDTLVLTPVSKTRKSWKASFQNNLPDKIEESVSEITDHSWDKEEWEW